MESESKQNYLKEKLIHNKIKVNKKLIIGLVVAGLISIAFITTLLVGYFKLEWFQKKQNNVIVNTYHKGQVLLFNEAKTFFTEVKTKEGIETVNEKIITDFLVMINSKKKLNYFGEIDNLYNATLVILKMSTKDEEIGGLNLLDEKESEKLLNNPKKHENPIAKFSFYENGTLHDIYIAKDTQQFYALSLVELIENIIPRISKKIYGKKDNDIEFLVKVKKDENEKIILEDHKDKEFTDKYSKIGFKGSKINKKITRKVINDSINQVTIESQLKLISEKPKNDETFYDIGLDKYTFKINSELNMVENKDDKELIKKIQLIVEKIDYEESQKLLEKLAENEMKDLSSIIKEEKNKNDIDKKEFRNLGNPITKNYNLTRISILGNSINFRYIVNFNDNSADYCFGAVTGNILIKLSQNNFTQPLSKKGQFGPINIMKIPFSVGSAPVKLQLKVKGDYSISFSSSKTSTESKATLSGTINSNFEGDLSSGIQLAKVSLINEGKFITLSGSKTANLKTGQITGKLNLVIGPMKMAVQVKIVLAKYKKTIYTSEAVSKII